MRVFPVLLALALPVPVMAQESATPKAPMDQVAWMLGEWEGPATYSRGGTGVIRQTERVELVSGGTAIAIRGRGFERTPDSKERVAFEAFAVMYKDRENKLAFRAWSMEGHYIDPAIELTPRGLVWSFDDPRGMKIRYTIVHTPADEWHEVGEWSRDGSSWTQFLEMRLNRVRTAVTP